MQLIILVEANSKSKIDYLYIREFINKYYPTNDKITPIYMGGKGNYNSSSIEAKIETEKVNYYKKTKKDSKIIICVDSDNLNNQIDIDKTRKIRDYCQKKDIFLLFSQKILRRYF